MKRPQNATYFVPLPDDHECYRLVGLIAAEVARIEALIDTSIWELARVLPVTGACITGQMVGTYPRYLALYQLAMLCELQASIIKEIKRQMEVANSVSDRRNRAVHDPWYVEELTGEPHQFRGRTKKDPTFGPQPVGIAKLRDDLTFIRQHKERAQLLHNSIWTALRS